MESTKSSRRKERPVYAFISHESACDILRAIDITSEKLIRWPNEPRELPRHRNTVTTQGMFKQFASTTDLPAYGLTRTPVDLLVSKAAQRSRGKVAQFHVWKGDVPAEAMVRLSEELFVSSPEFVLVQMAGWHTKIAPVVEGFADELSDTREAYAMAHLEGEPPYDDPFVWDQTSRLLQLALVAMEFMGSYRLSSTSETASYERAPLTSADDIRQFVSSLPRVYGKNRIETALTLALPHSASPMETALALMLSLPVEYGGFGLPKPELNRSLPVDAHETLWSGGPAITPDFLWTEANLVIEYESNEWHGGAGARKLAHDATRANVLSTMGYHVMRVTTLNIQQLAEVERLARQVAMQLGVTLAEPDDAMRIRRTKLHQLLMSQ